MKLLTRQAWPRAIVRRKISPFENPASTLYNLGRNSLPDAAANPAPATRPRRWSIVAAGLLLGALALVVIYTSRSAFFSPLALVVVAAIGLAALLLQLRLRKDQNNDLSNKDQSKKDLSNNDLRNNDLSTPVRAPLWLNVLGLVFAIAAVFADVLHLSPNLLLIAALGAVLCFAVSGATVLHALRSKKI